MSRLPLLSLSESQELVVSIDASTKHREDFITPRKVAKKTVDIRFSFPIDLFAEVEDHVFTSV